MKEIASSTSEERLDGQGARSAGGRPPKFRESRRPITVTLPDRILDQLEVVDQDRARAIVKCVESVMCSEHEKEGVRLVQVSKGKALITVGPTKSLRHIPWLSFAEVSPARYLLVLTPGTSVDSLEVAILDLIESLGPDEEAEKATLNALRTLIGRQRRKKTVSKAELVFVDVQDGES